MRRLGSMPLCKRISQVCTKNTLEIILTCWIPHMLVSLLDYNLYCSEKIKYSYGLWFFRNNPLPESSSKPLYPSDKLRKKRT